MSDHTAMPVLDSDEDPFHDTSFSSVSADLRPFFSEEPVSFTGFQGIPESSTSNRNFTVRPRSFRLFQQQTEQVTLLEKWEGFVSEILQDGFRAKFRKNSSDFKEVVAEFDTDELSDDDRKILAVGMPLVWSITRERRNGGVQRCSVLVIRRQPREIPPVEEGFLNRLNDWIRPG